MKKILNKLGYTTRSTLIGVGLGVATLAVGVGVVFNTMDSSSGAINGGAVSGGGYYSSFSQQGSGNYAQAPQQYGSALDSSRQAVNAAKGSDFSKNYDTRGGYATNAAAVDSDASYGGALGGQIDAAGGFAGQRTSSVSAQEMQQYEKAKAEAEAGIAGLTSGKTAAAQQGSRGFGSSSFGGNSGFRGSSVQDQYSAQALAAKGGAQGGVADSGSMAMSGNLSMPSSNLPKARSGRVESMSGNTVGRGSGGAAGNQRGAFRAGSAMSELGYVGRAMGSAKTTAAQGSGKVAANVIDQIYQGANLADGGISIDSGSLSAEGMSGDGPTANAKRTLNAISKKTDEIQEADNKERKANWNVIANMFAAITTVATMSAVIFAASKSGPWGWVAMVGAMATCAFMIGKLLNATFQSNVSPGWKVAGALVAAALTGWVVASMFAKLGGAEAVKKGVLKIVNNVNGWTSKTLGFDKAFGTKEAAAKGAEEVAEKAAESATKKIVTDALIEEGKNTVQSTLDAQANAEKNGY
ncbi:hypothetical protein Dip518_000040 [Parelusimicrobium proximum]|uniref:hypothetical protein n=1 Tax=Parelusimicrobium proximum TaxID=3228953 RepID=UPI003D162ED2